MPKHSNTELSRIINEAMDYAGYSKEMINVRAAAQKRIAEKTNHVFSQTDLLSDIRAESVFVGSKSEGVVQLLESDIDLLFVFRNFLCVDSGRIENDLTVIQTDFAESPPGYTKLIPLDMNHDEIGSALLDGCTVYDLQKCRFLLLSSCIRNSQEESMRTVGNTLYAGIQTEIKPNSGPSVPVSINFTLNGAITQQKIPITYLEEDNVIAMPYFSSTILETWKERSRKHGWPPRNVIDDISTMEGFVVPVGPKYSEEQNYEWRICYTTAEQKLVAHLSSVQLKLYVLMKMIFKQIIGPECDLITSYMVKNIVFWVCEGTDADLTHDKLIDLLLHSLSFTFECLHSNFLPNYMIPSRNLLLGKGNHQDKIKLRRILRNLIKERGAVVFRLRKLSTVTTVLLKNPMLGKSYGNWRNKVENLILIILNMVCHKLSPVLLLQHGMIFDVLFERWKDPLFFEVGLSLLQLLNVDVLQEFTDFVPCNHNIIDVLNTLFS